MYWPSTSQVGTSPTSLGSPPWRGMAVWLAAVEVVLCLGSGTVWLWLVPSQADYVWGALQASCVWLLPWPACPGWMQLIGPVESRPGLTPGRCRSTGSGTVWSQ